MTVIFQIVAMDYFRESIYTSKTESYEEAERLSHYLLEQPTVFSVKITKLNKF